jgi:hypothetical protein
VVLAVWVTACSFEVLASSEGKLVGRLLVCGESADSANDVLSIGFIEFIVQNPYCP